MITNTLSEFLRAMLVLMALFDSDPQTTVGWAKSFPTPMIKIVSNDYLKENICSCSCEAQYTGKFSLIYGSVPALLLSVKDPDNIPINDPGFRGLIIHELVHYKQFMHGEYNGIIWNGDKDLTDPEIHKIMENNETDAYMAQNKYLIQQGRIPLPVVESVQWSVNETTNMCDNQITVAGKPNRRY